MGNGSVRYSTRQVAIGTGIGSCPSLRSARSLIAAAALPFHPEGPPRMVRFIIAVFWLALLLLPGQTSIAGVSDSLECRRDLVVADQLIHAVRLREHSVQPGDFSGMCRVLRQNLEDMTNAREPMARCMTGHDLGENVGQMDVSIDDIRFVLSKHCVGR
jgi:hypothetical protein